MQKSHWKNGHTFITNSTPRFQKELKDLDLLPISLHLFSIQHSCFAAMSSLWDVDGSHQSRSLSEATATCQLTSSRSLPMAAGIYPGPSWIGTCADEGHVFLWCVIIKGLSRRSMRHQEAIDERLIKGINADWHFYLRIIKGRQNESSRFGGVRLMNM